MGSFFFLHFSAGKEHGAGNIAGDDTAETKATESPENVEESEINIKRADDYHSVVLLSGAHAGSHSMGELSSVRTKMLNSEPEKESTNNCNTFSSNALINFGHIFTLGAQKAEAVYFQIIRIME